MAVSLLVANSKPAKRLGRPSFRRVDPRPEPSQSEEVKITKEKKKKNKKKEAVKLLLWAETEEWQQQGSDHIHTGYRRATGSVRECLASWTFVHNETVNIFSHVVGAAAFLVVVPAWCASLAAPRWQQADAGDALACGAYLAGVAACFVLSAAFHTLMAHSEAVYLAGMKLDVQGVLALMWGATAPLVRYALPCGDDDEARLRLVYGWLIAGLAAACSVATFLPCFSGPRLGPWRAALFGAFGLGSFALPLAHAAARAGWAEMSARVGLWWVGATAVLNGVGVVVYGLKFPERWFPRRFDLFGASHQLMHVFVVAAALTYTRAVVLAFDYRHRQAAVC